MNMGRILKDVDYGTYMYMYMCLGGADFSFSSLSYKLVLQPSYIMYIHQALIHLFT